MTEENFPKSSADIANEFKLLEASSRKLFNLPPYVNPNEFDAWKKEKEDNINKTNLLREQTKIREETYTGRSKYLERLSTYSASFISNTTPVNPSQCAMQGWYDTNNKCQAFGSEVFRLICRECNNHLDVPNLTGANASFESVKKINTLYPKYLFTIHNETCFWRYNSCHVSVCAFPLVTTADAFNLLETQGKLFQKWETDLPLITNPYGKSKDIIIERIIKSIENIDVFDFPRQSLTQIQITSYLLPMFGWNCLEEQNYKILKCSSCFRHIWISNYLLMKDQKSNDNHHRENTIQYHSRTERIKDQLNPIDEHRYYCPWKNTKMARINLKDSYFIPHNQPLTGYQWMMEMLVNEFFKLTTEDDKHNKRNEFRKKIEKHISATVEANKWMTQDLSNHVNSRKLKRTLSESDDLKTEKINDELNEIDNDNDSNTNVKKVKYKNQFENIQPSNYDQSSTTSASPLPSIPTVNDIEMDTSIVDNQDSIKVPIHPPSIPVTNNNETDKSIIVNNHTSNDNDTNEYNIKQENHFENTQQINDDQNNLIIDEQQQLQQEKEKEFKGNATVVNNIFDASLSTIDMTSIMSPSLITSSPLPTDLLLNDIGSPAILENIQTPEILNDDDLISDQITKVDDDDDHHHPLNNDIKTSENEEIITNNNNDNVNKVSLLEQKQENDSIELLDINKEESSGQKVPSGQEDLIEKENKSVNVEEIESKKIDEKDQDLNVQENNQVDVQISENIHNENEEFKKDQMGLEKENEDDKQQQEQSENDKADENNVTKMELVKENEEEKIESLEDGELDDEQNIQLDYTISEDIITTNKDDESSKLQDIQTENNEIINEREYLDNDQMDENEKEEDGSVDLQEEKENEEVEEELLSTNLDADMKFFTDDEDIKEKENVSINIKDDLEENKGDFLIKEMDDDEQEIKETDDNGSKEKEEILKEGEYSIIQGEEDEVKEEHLSNQLDEEMTDLLDEEKDNESIDIQEAHQMEEELVNDIENHIIDHNNNEDELVDIQEVEEEEGEVQMDNTDADQEMDDLLKNNENSHEDEIKQDDQLTHTDSEMNQLLGIEKIEEKEEIPVQEENPVQEKEESPVQEEESHVQKKEKSPVQEEEIYVDIQVEEIRLDTSDSGIKVSSSSSSPSLTSENTGVIESNNDNAKVAELKNIQDDLQDDHPDDLQNNLQEDNEEVLVEKEELDISLGEEEVDKGKSENEIDDEIKYEKESENEYDDLEALQSSSEKISEPINVNQESVNTQEDNQNINNDDLENSLVEEDVVIVEDIDENNNNSDKVNEEGFIEVQEDGFTEIEEEMADPDTIINNNNDNNESTNEVDHKKEDGIENNLIEEIDKKKKQEMIIEEGEYDHLDEDLPDLLDDQDNDLIQIETPVPIIENEEE